MFSFLFIRHLVRPKALKDVPTEDYRCGFNYNGSKFDVSEISKLGKVFNFTDETKDYMYYVRLCDDIADDQYPEHAKYQFGVNGIRVNTQTNFTEPIAFHDTQTYDLAGSSPDEGFIIQTSAQTSDPESKLPFIRLSFVFTPSDENSTDPVDINFFEEGNSYIVAIVFATAYAKPQQAEIPPDPPLPPTCKNIYYSTQVYPYGIALNLADLNFGPHGFPITFDDDPNKIALYQPCGFSKCPTDFDCGEYKTASAWVCNKSLKCEGFSTPKVEFDYLYEDPDEGFTFTYQPEDDNQIKVDAVCDFSLTKEEMTIESSRMENESSLKIRIHTGSACMQPLENSNPNQCKARLNDTISVLDVDLSVYTKEDGWKFNVSNSQWEESHWVYLQPCGPLICPADSCPNSTGATIYLCNEKSDGSTVCYDYGMFRNQIDIDIFRNLIEDGITWTYTGTSGRSAEVRVTCDWKLPEKTLEFQNRLSYTEEGNKILLWASTRDVCIGQPPLPPQTPLPTPKPEEWPPVPDPAPSGRPTGQKLPTVYVRNETHSIVFDMRKYVYERDAKITYIFKSQEARVSSSPFSPQACPNGYQCKGVDNADYWLCWQENCYPMMLGSTNGINYTTEGGTLNGVYVSTNGYFDTKLTLSISCSEDTMRMNNGYIDVNDEVSFDGDNGYTVYSEWSEVCPREGVQPYFPTPVTPLTPTPSPNPEPIDVSYYDREYGFDFKDFDEKKRRKEIGEVLFQTSGNSYENASLTFDPLGKIECPSGAECKGVEYSSAWKCWDDVITKNKDCVSLADARYAPKSVSQNKIVYSSGYNGYSLELDLYCNPDEGSDSYSLSSVARENKSNLTVWLTAYSAAFCKGRGLGVKPTSGGAIFLLILLIVTITYLVCGVFANFLKIGKFALPNASFWKEFANCVVAGYYGITCRKSLASTVSVESTVSAYSSI